MAALLLYSKKCENCLNLLAIIQKNMKILQPLISFHDVNTRPIPPQIRAKIKSVPTLITQDGRIMVGRETFEWVKSMLPQEEVGGLGSTEGMQDLDDSSGGGDMFGLDSYGASLKPHVSKEVEERINKDVSAAYNERNN